MRSQSLFNTFIVRVFEAYDTAKARVRVPYLAPYQTISPCVTISVTASLGTTVYSYCTTILGNPYQRCVRHPTLPQRCRSSHMVTRTVYGLRSVEIVTGLGGLLRVLAPS
eukprot:scaffold305872_cov24-Prasinocladus_malaysianus.AAC.1